MTSRTTDPYAVLGVPRGATAREVQQAYRRLAKRYHPDLHRDTRAGEQMRRINEAREILTSPARRRPYETDSSRPASAGSPRRPGRATAPPPPWRATPAGSGPRVQAESEPAVIPWGALVLAIPLTALGFFALATGILPPLLLGFLVLVFARSALRSLA